MLSFEDKILMKNRGNVKITVGMSKICFARRLLKADILNMSYKKKLLTYLTHRLILLLSNEIR